MGMQFSKLLKVIRSYIIKNFCTADTNLFKEMRHLTNLCTIAICNKVFDAIASTYKHARFP